MLHPSYATVDCLYGIDGATYHLDNPAKPGVCSFLEAGLAERAVDVYVLHLLYA